MSEFENRLKEETERTRISLDSLRKYAPIYQEGLAAQQKLNEKYSHEDAESYVFTNPDGLSAAYNNVDVSDVDQILEVSELESIYYRGEFAAEKLVEQATPLLHSEVAKIAARASFHEAEEVHQTLFYEACAGLKKGLAKYDATKNQSSVTNYLFQWATTMAKRLLNRLEAPYGVSPSRFEKFKKVAAVRSKMTEQIGRYATNSEVYDYFVTGQADIRTFNGPVLKAAHSRANREMDIKLIEDQEYFEQNLAYTKYIDDDSENFYPENISEYNKELVPGERSVFRDFVEEYDFTDEALAVILNETQSEVPEDLMHIVQSFDDNEDTKAKHKLILRDWRSLIREKNGPFHSFVRGKVAADDIFGYDVDIRKLLKILDDSESVKIKRKYKSLFGDKKTMTNSVWQNQQEISDEQKKQ